MWTEEAVEEEEKELLYFPRAHMEPKRGFLLWCDSICSWYARYASASFLCEGLQVWAEWPLKEQTGNSRCSEGAVDRAAVCRAAQGKEAEVPGAQRVGLSQLTEEEVRGVCAWAHWNQQAGSQKSGDVGRQHLGLSLLKCWGFIAPTEIGLKNVEMFLLKLCSFSF